MITGQQPNKLIELVKTVRVAVLGPTATEKSHDYRPTGEEKLAALAELLKPKKKSTEPKKTHTSHCEFTAADRHVHQVAFGCPAP